MTDLAITLVIISMIIQAQFKLMMPSHGPERNVFSVPLDQIAV